MRRHFLAALAGALLLSGCAVGGGDEPSGTPRRDLAARPSALPTDLPGQPRPHPTAAPSTSTSGSSTSGPPTVPTGNGTTAGPSIGGQPAAPATYRDVTSISDLRGDPDPSAPGYADLASVRIEDDGTHARITVTVSGSLPGRTADGEVMGIGVDFYRQGNTGRESDYQLFADGEPTGWYAYLQTPKGFVRYPGQFALGGGTLIFTVPWSAIGAPRSGRFSVFVDWTRRSSAVTGNQGSNDYAPALGTSAYSR